MPRGVFLFAAGNDGDAVQIPAQLHYMSGRSQLDAT